ncbi:hypothetical protein PHYBLDRAFT_189218 [Phycomyces blakesleeanus NRRL 1555(-)]|uniref:Uncharacterized protein n=1 Tax=Phycomyces blakesleeanus (strain ATCC 8743b / DSM 1359 / FGSC 10004 / NBRC 33097 / NRRL 1555) TaxID=763407 RepID=A0A162T6U7_PHYB8|nr:hypothetical protein PHYBLDRAFT_189218 [Phycomyces blakesleeanus NRRL 1555(-)]OAD66632.1 hypothetical protein PHYBLDRAFT_189218 [Phycomyces blakesleeanus NRRL 1555(-)]|eukprot:XP_018284672.1 hypothetical protein PHYBLDRAFT_189218 [Phycomyces blakesleeanus NRRL 1555(-)]
MLAKTCKYILYKQYFNRLKVRENFMFIARKRYFIYMLNCVTQIEKTLLRTVILLYVYVFRDVLLIKSRQIMVGRQFTPSVLRNPHFFSYKNRYNFLFPVFPPLPPGFLSVVLGFRHDAVSS